MQNRTALWIPQSKPQWIALLSRADEIYYGGAAGGGKSDLLLGLAIECHEHSVIFRRTYPNLQGIMRRCREIINNPKLENKSDKLWTFPNGRTIEFGAVQYEEDKLNWQGRPHDLKGVDEIPELTESQYVFITGWLRTTNKSQRVRIVATGNPPINEAGNWVVRRWGAWLDKKHPNPAKPGELRWYATVDGEEREFMDGAPIVDSKGETVYPLSRTFIPAKLEDNVFLSEDNRYKAVLQALPEPLRSQLLHGDFDAAATPDPWQIIPTQWVLDAQERWRNMKRPTTPLTAVGIDPARGGRDNMSMAKRYDNWFDVPVFWPGSTVKDGPVGAELIRQSMNGEKPGIINIDVGGIGSSVFDSLKPMYQTNAVNAASGSEYRDKSGKLKMRNLRAEYYWQMRDALDPQNGMNVCLPPGNEIVADLCSARYKIATAGVLVEEKEEIKRRIGRSPDKGESILYANYITQQSDRVKISPVKVTNYTR